jgi:hypothetical protein
VCIPCDVRALCRVQHCSASGVTGSETAVSQLSQQALIASSTFPLELSRCTMNVLRHAIVKIVRKLIKHSARTMSMTRMRTCQKLRLVHTRRPGTTQSPRAAVPLSLIQPSIAQASLSARLTRLHPASSQTLWPHSRLGSHNSHCWPVSHGAAAGCPQGPSPETARIRCTSPQGGTDT